MEVSMRFIGARASDWHSGNPNIRIGPWLGLFAGAAILYLVLIGLTGSLVNSDATAFLH
jgi:hypothetical protein